MVLVTNKTTGDEVSAAEYNEIATGVNTVTPKITAIGNLSGTNTGDQTSIVGITGTTAQFNTALSDGNFATLAGTEALTNKTVNGLTLTNGGTGALTITGTSSISGTHSGTSSGTNTGNQTISDATISTTDITTNNVSTSKHGFFPKLPTATGLYLKDDLTWGSPVGAGDMILASIQTVTGAKTFNDAKFILAGLTSGTTTLKSGAVAGTSVITLPVATDTLVGKATTDTLTNKTLTSPKINEAVNLTTTSTKLNYLTSATGTTGTNTTNIVFSTSPTITTPTFATVNMNNTDIQNIRLAEFSGIVDNGNSSTADTINYGTGNFQKSTLTGNCTYTFTAPSGPARVTLLVYTGTGSFSITWPATVKWSGGTAPTTTVTASKVDIFTFLWDGTNYFGTYTQNYTG